MEGNSHERNSCQWKDIPVTGKKFLSKEGNSGYRKGIPATRWKFLLKEIHSCNRREIPFTRRKFLLQEGNSCYRNYIPDTGGKSCYRKEILGIGEKFCCLKDIGKAVFLGTFYISLLAFVLTNNLPSRNIRYTKPITNGDAYFFHSANVPDQWDKLKIIIGRKCHFYFRIGI